MRNYCGAKYLTLLPPSDQGFECVLHQGQNLVKIEITAGTVEEQPYDWRLNFWFNPNEKQNFCSPPVLLVQQVNIRNIMLESLKIMMHHKTNLRQWRSRSDFRYYVEVTLDTRGLMESKDLHVSSPGNLDLSPEKAYLYRKNTSQTWAATAYSTKLVSSWKCQKKVVGG